MPPVIQEFTIVDDKNRRLWVRHGAGFDATQALASLALLQTRFPSIGMFLLATSPDEAGGPPRRWMLRNPNLRAASLQGQAVHGAEPGTGEAEAPSDPAGAAAMANDPLSNDQGLAEVEVWHRRLLIRHLNYPGLPFATEAPERLPRTDFEHVADFLAPARQPLNSVFRMSQNSAHVWLPGEDRRSTSIGDVLVVKNRHGAPDSNWLVMAMGFDRLATFD